MTNLSNQSPHVPLLGCIADDVTGATDLASNLVLGGVRVVQTLGTPSPEAAKALDADVVVVALKTRSLPAGDAVAQSLAAARSLSELGVRRLFFKYCSTFDSTEQGNIGPVASALLDEVGDGQTIFCPAFPANGRTVYQGHLFVNGRLLNESGMERHPLTPMTDANLLRLLEKQTDRTVGLLDYLDLTAGRAKARLKELQGAGVSFVVVDACDDHHLRLLADVAAGMRLVTGGSGIARFLPECYRRLGLLSAATCPPGQPDLSGRALIVSGSCSEASNRQVDWMKSKIPSLPIDVAAVVANYESALADVVHWARAVDGGQPLMIYSTQPPRQSAGLHVGAGGRRVGELIEEFLANAAARIVRDRAIQTLVCAGGETTGAVLERLGVKQLRIGPEICPGAPWTESIGEPSLTIVCKSGNFGEKEFFAQALGWNP